MRLDQMPGSETALSTRSTRKGYNKEKSEFGKRLEEKQKLKAIYGVSETQLRRIFKQASRKIGATGENLLAMLESRLDNIVYRLGFAPTRQAARQLVVHKHIQVNDGVVNIPSYRLKPNDKIRVRPKSKKLEVIKESLANVSEENLPSFLNLNKSDLEGTFKDTPKRFQIPEDIQERLIVEYYSR